MANTNTKEVSKRIQEHILSKFDSYEDMMNELKNYQKNFGASFGKTFALEGNLLVYDSEVDKFFQDVLKQTPEEQGKYSSKETWELYTNLIQREAAHIVSEDSHCYIKQEPIKLEKPIAKENGWIADSGDRYSETLPYNSINGEKIFFKIQHGHDGRDDCIGLSCLSRDPSEMTDQERHSLRPDHIFYDGENSHYENLETAKNIVGKTVADIERLDQWKMSSTHFSARQGHSFESIKKIMLLNVAEDMAQKINLEAMRSLKELSDIMATGESRNVFNGALGCGISIDKGHTGKDGYGLLHIIEGRHAKDRLGENETTALLYKVRDAAKNGRLTYSITIKQKDNDERVGIEKDGIVAIAGRRKGTGENFVITGYEINNKKEEAAEAVQTVIAKYGRTPEFSDFRKRVGAAVSSLQQASRQTSEKSSEIEAAKKAGYVQGVCECVAAIGSDYALGKKLLKEMSVTKKMAKEYANPETFRALKSGIFAKRQEHKLERQQRRGHKQ
jgi:hypothetical protein